MVLSLRWLVLFADNRRSRKGGGSERGVRKFVELLSLAGVSRVEVVPGETGALEGSEQGEVHNLMVVHVRAHGTEVGLGICLGGEDAHTVVHAPLGALCVPSEGKEAVDVEVAHVDVMWVS